MKSFSRKGGPASKGFFGPNALTLGSPFPAPHPSGSAPLFTAVGSNTTNPNTGAVPFIATRPVGTPTWTVRSSTLFAGNGLFAVSKAVNKWVIGSNNGTHPSIIGVSSDGHTYTAATNPDNTTTFTACSGSANVALLGGDSVVLLGSPDTVTWTDTNAIFAGSFVTAGITFSSVLGLYACTGTGSSDNNHGFSANGVAWTNATYQSFGGFSLATDANSIIGVAARIGGGRVLVRSTDGNNYTETVLTSFPTGRYIAWNGSVYVICDNAHQLIHSATLAGLAAAVPQTVATGNFTAITAYPTSGLFMAVADDGHAYSSPDGVAWTQENTGAGALILTAVAVG